jgi:hypothetical protein
MRAAVVGALVGVGATVGVAYLRYTTIDKPALDDTRQKYADEKTARQKAEEESMTARQQIDDLKQKYRVARDQFISKVSKAITEASKPLPGSESGKPVRPTATVLIPLARRIVDERDDARRGIRQVSNHLEEIYKELDSDIDEIKDIIDHPNVDPQKLLTVIQRLNANWSSKLKLMDQLVQSSIELLGCPMLFATNPVLPKQLRTISP